MKLKLLRIENALTGESIEFEEGHLSIDQDDLVKSWDVEVYGICFSCLGLQLGDTYELRFLTNQGIEYQGKVVLKEAKSHNGIYKFAGAGPITNI